jgi:hypothetical protein
MMLDDYLLQSDESLIGVMGSEMRRLFKMLIFKFVKKDKIKEAADPLKVDDLNPDTMVRLERIGTLNLPYKGNVRIAFSPDGDVLLALKTVRQEKRSSAVTGVAGYSPHPKQNSDSERVFSMMKKVHTEYRSQRKNDTICAILATKINTDMECYNCETNKELLAVAKQATWKYVQEHK